MLILSLLWAPIAGAQIALPGSPVPAIGLPGRPLHALGIPAHIAQVRRRIRPVRHTVHGLEHARRLHILALLHRYPHRIGTDPQGNPIVRGQVLALGLSRSALQQARTDGFSVLARRRLKPLDLHLTVLRTPGGESVARAIHTLRRLDPEGQYDFNAIYTDSGVVSAHAPPRRQAADAVPAARGAHRPALGLIDGGVEVSEPVFHASRIRLHGCGGHSVPSAHGTAVASLMVGRGKHFRGAAPGATLYAANVYCARPTGGAVTAIARAFAWLARQPVTVINVSLVGPSNALLHAVIRRVLARGILIVAAVGNDGPAAPPLYPAAYRGVIGVTAVGQHRRVLFEAERGPQVMFAAPGANIEAAHLPHGYAYVRGTSFAAPLVAGVLASHLRTPTPNAAHVALRYLIHQAIHLGPHGRNRIYGYGLVAAALPSPP